MYCPMCQSAIKDSDVFCSRCKNKIPRCPTCKKVIYEKSRFCMDDGTELPDDVIAVFSLFPSSEPKSLQDEVNNKSQNSVQSEKQKRVFVGLTVLLIVAVSVFLCYILLRGNSKGEDLLQETNKSAFSETVLVTELTTIEGTLESSSYGTDQEPIEDESSEQESYQSEAVQTEPSELDSSEFAPVENPFVDIDESKYYAQYVMWAVENGIASGIKAHKFYPDEDCTRGQIVTFLWRAAGSPEPAATETPFNDVLQNSYYYKAILWAMENGIASGTGRGTFSPEDSCTRGQALLFLWRANGSPAPQSTDNPFKDLDENTYYYSAVLWAAEQGISSGVGRGKFAADDACTRGQAVAFLYRAFEETVP